MEITVLKKLKSGYLVTSSDGETAYITEEIYQKLVKQNKIKSYA